MERAEEGEGKEHERFIHGLFLASVCVSVTLMLFSPITSATRVLSRYPHPYPPLHSSPVSPSALITSVPSPEGKVRRDEW